MVRKREIHVGRTSKKEAHRKEKERVMQRVMRERLKGKGEGQKKKREMKGRKEGKGGRDVRERRR